jgi:hypothetical protein
MKGEVLFIAQLPDRPHAFEFMHVNLVLVFDDREFGEIGR